MVYICISFSEKVVNLVVNRIAVLPALLLMADEHFLRFHNPVKFRFGILKLYMGIGIQSHADIRVPHNVLQRFGVHSALCHIGTKGVAADMGCDFGKLYLVDAVVFVADMLEVVLPVQGDHWHLIFIQKKKSGVAIDHRLFAGL